MKNFLLSVVCFLASMWQGFAQIPVDAIVNKMKLFENDEVLAIRTNLEATFEEVQKNNSWKAYDSIFKDEPNSAIWLKFEIENNASDSLQIYYFSVHDFISIYQKQGNAFKTYRNGNLVPLYDRSNKNEFYATELKLSPLQKSVVYVRQNSTKQRSENRISELFSKKSYLELAYNYTNSENKSIAFVFFYIISLITVLVFGLVFWLRLRQRLYAYYLGYLFFQIIYAFTVLQITSATV